jgi:hypothetical protein
MILMSIQSVFLNKNMTEVLLLHPKINCVTIPPVVPVKILKLYPPVVISTNIFPGLFLHFHVCVFEEEINIIFFNFYLVRSFLYGY